MIRKRSSTRISLIAFSAALAASACTEPGGAEQSPELGSVEQALGRGDNDRGHGEGSRHAPWQHHKLFKVQRHFHPRCQHPPAPPQDPVVFTPQSAAGRSGRRAGVAVDHNALANEPIYSQLVTEQFSDVTPENAMKWGPLQPESPKRWDFDAADAIVDFAEQNEMPVKGHTLIWHQQLPGFIDAGTEPRELKKYAERHIEKTVNRYRRDLFAWDVVNEAIADDGSGLRVTPFSTAFGEQYIDRAFRDANQADRDAQLYYNDYGIEGINAKSDAVYALMQRLLQRRVPIDGIGLQGHFDARFMPSLEDMVANFQRFADLGLNVNISELDVRVAALGGTRAYRLAVQKQIYQRVAAACSQVEGCDGITTWGFTDAHSWVDATFGADDPLLFDDQYQKKPAYFGYVDGFLGVPLDDASLEPNLVGNSALEAGLDGWSVMGDGTISTEIAAAHTGLRSLRAGGRTASWQGPRHDVTALVRAGRTYDASVFARLAGAASANVSLTAQVTCAGEASTFLPMGSATATDTGWVELSGSFELPNCELESVAVYVEGPDAGVDLLVDDLALRENPLPNLVTNSTFEAGTAGWFGWGPTVVGTTTDANGGSLAVRGSGRTDTWNGVATDLTSRVVANGTYRAEAFMKVANAPSAPVALTAAVTCPGQATQFLRVGQATATDTGYVLVSGSVTVPNCTPQSFYLYGEGPAAGVDLLMDDVAFWLLELGQAPSVISNGGFETNTDGWFGFGAVTLASTPDRARTGSRSGRVSGRTDSWNGMATSLVGRLTPGKSYAFSAWAQVGTGSSSVNFTFQNACTDGATNFNFLAGATANDSSWTQLQGTLVAPSCTLSTANFYIEGAPAGVDIYLDDVEMRELP